MQPIQMVDLQNQYHRYKNEIDSAIQNVLDSGAFIKGKEVAELEQKLAEFTGSKYVIGCANGTDALQVAFMALNLPAGSEVITPAFSYAAVAEVLHLLQLKPVYCEVIPGTFLMDPKSVESLIGPNTRAITPVHLYGQCCDMEIILDIAAKHRLYVIEDTAQAIGAFYTFSNGNKAQAGTMGHIGTTSFFPSKNLGCYGDGGAIFCSDDSLAKKIKMVANHGQEIKYKHEVVGVNSRLDTIQAAILLVKLKYLRDFEKARNNVANKYDEGFAAISGLKTPERAENSTHVFHQYTLTLEDAAKRDTIMAYLKENQIPSMIYYPLPLYQQQAYKAEIKMQPTEQLCASVFSLPIHTEMTDIQIEYIISKVKEFLNS
ncbi:MAG: DegT/DnrJ/EryC1/StrS family aminotransferase [Bacteroidetes bacterium]|nr:DegT/DnrJ/EryC1/StrS family aminotransferase [Bacteroidota bacterium]